MQLFRPICWVLILIFLSFCSKDDLEKNIIKENSLELQVLEAYEEGLKSLNEGDALFAAKKFNEAETLFPQSEWAPKSALMAAYSYYAQDYYLDSIAELERFKRVYPFYKNMDYVYYLLGLNWYEQIIDEKKDLETIINAKENFIFLIINYPNTEYALDAEFKVALIDDVLASKEMYIGRYYLQKKKWIPAINRFKNVIDEYDTTTYTEEALYRLVETYYKIGLIDEAKKYANLLGYNYLSSKWYEKSYILFNENFENKLINTIKKDKKNKKSFLKKFKSLFD
ncbi:outer membrane protein assembly factor BamD [Candidatus Pelagibacter sp. HIMB1506]|uniref:outer membrane protein assembly factor BamD n=1 Tax=Candidatus Pelagibacter sp. HIMB1506 TaxID=3413337 RepID=UPI003F8350CC